MIDVEMAVQCQSRKSASGRAARVPALMRDRYLAPDLVAATALVHAGALSRMFRSLPALAALWVPA